MGQAGGGTGATDLAEFCDLVIMEHPYLQTKPLWNHWMIFISQSSLCRARHLSLLSWMRTMKGTIIVCTRVSCLAQLSYCKAAQRCHCRRTYATANHVSSGPHLVNLIYLTIIRMMKKTVARENMVRVTTRT